MITRFFLYQQSGSSPVKFIQIKNLYQRDFFVYLAYGLAIYLAVGRV